MSSVIMVGHQKGYRKKLELVLHPYFSYSLPNLGNWVPFCAGHTCNGSNLCYFRPLLSKHSR
eukprot:6281869-Amphidinium_carterae.1